MSSRKPTRVLTQAEKDYGATLTPTQPEAGRASPLSKSVMDSNQVILTLLDLLATVVPLELEPLERFAVKVKLGQATDEEWDRLFAQVRQLRDSVLSDFGLFEAAELVADEVLDGEQLAFGFDARERV